MKHCHFTILYNEIDFLRLKMPFLYEHFDQLIFYDLSAFGNERKFSNDGSHEFIKNYPDPENKITLIEETNLDSIQPLGASNQIKQKMFSYGSQFIHDDIDVFWCTDIDEFFKKELIEEVETIFKRSLNSIAVKFYNFYKTTDFLLSSNGQLSTPQNDSSPVRIARHKPGNKYGHCNIGKEYKPVNLTTKNFIYHFPWVGEKRVREKFSYYKDNPVTGFVSMKYIKEWEEFSEAKFNALNKRGFYGNPFVGPGRFERNQVARCPFDVFEELPYLNKEFIKKIISGTNISLDVPITDKKIDLSFIIPIRGREDQIAGLEYNISKYFQDYNYEIIYVHQNDNKLFKRGQLCNIGFKEAKGEIIIFQDVDIRHFRKIDVKKLLEYYRAPFVAFDQITQIYEHKLGEYQNIKTEKRINGWGACTVFNRKQFIESGGFSNLIFGWGAEDNILNERTHFKRLNQNLGHVYHSASQDIKSKSYKNNVSLWTSIKNIDSKKDGINQTIYNINKKIKNSNILNLSVVNIRVPNDYEYISLYEKYAKDANERNPIKVLFVADTIGWAFDNIASGVIKYNPYPDKIFYDKRFIREMRKTNEKINLNEWDYVYVMWEGEISIPNSEKVVRGCYSARWLELPSITKKTIGDTFSKNKAAIFANESLRNEILPYLPIGFKQTIIHDSADDELFYPIPNAKLEKFTAIFVGNTDRAIKNFPIIKQICEETNINLIIAKNILHHQLVNEYNKADICINFSNSEGGPQTFSEAALCGVPMLIRSSNALSYKIPCFKGDTKKDFIKIILDLKNNREKCVQKGLEAREVVLKEFTYKVASKKFSDFFLNLNNPRKLDDLTVFVISTENNPNYQNCLSALSKQTVSFKIKEIKGVAPMPKAYQQMIDECETSYYIQVDEDMILYSNAIETLYNSIKSKEDNVSMVVYNLFDVHLNFNILGVKINNHDILKKYPRWNKHGSILDVDQNRQMERDGYKIVVCKDVIGDHSPLWTNELIFNRYFELIQRWKKYNYDWMSELPKKLTKLYKNDPSEINFYALMGAMYSLTSTEKINISDKNFNIKNKYYLELQKILENCEFKFII